MLWGFFVLSLAGVGGSSLVSSGGQSFELGFVFTIVADLLCGKPQCTALKFFLLGLLVCYLTDAARRSSSELQSTGAQSGMGLDPPFRDSPSLVPLLRFPSFRIHRWISPEAVTIPRHL